MTHQTQSPLHLTLDNAHTHLSAIGRTDNTTEGYISLCSANPTDWEQIALVAAKSEGRVIPSFGIHPWFVDQTLQTLPDALHHLIEQYPAAGIGETGLDKTLKAPASITKQKDILLLHIGLAKQYDRVLSLHCVKAWGTLFDILAQTTPPKILLHAWNGHQDMIPGFAKLGCFFSIGQKALSSPDAAQWLPLIPTDKLLLETDEDNAELPDLFEQLADRLHTNDRRTLAETLHANFSRLFL